MSALRAEWDAARAQWRGIDVSFDAFEAYVGARVGGAPLALSDCYLACALGSGDRAALALFEAQLVPRLARVLAARGANDDTISEALQRMRQRLFVGTTPKITQYSGKGALQAWLRVVTVRELLQLQRAAPREKGVEDDRLFDRASAGDDPELEHLKTKYRAEFREAFAAALADLEANERNILRYHYLDGLTMDRIGALSGVHQTTVTRRLAKARQSLLDGTVSKMRRTLAVDAEQMQSIVRMIQSQLDVSLGGLMRDGSS